MSEHQPRSLPPEDQMRWNGQTVNRTGSQFGREADSTGPKEVTATENKSRLPKQAPHVFILPATAKTVRAAISVARQIFGTSHVPRVAGL